MAGLGTIATVLSIAGGVANAVGTVAAGRAQIQAGRDQQAVANFEADQLDMQAKEERAAAQQEALQLKRQKTLALSKLQARGAASGFTATDPSALHLAGEIEGYGTLQQQLAMYGGDSRARGLTASADARRFEGRAAARGGKLAAAGTIIGGISSMADRFSAIADKYAPKKSNVSYYYG